MVASRHRSHETPQLVMGPQGPGSVAIVLPVTGTTGNDTLVGTVTSNANNNDTISGLAGDDIIFGESTVPGTTGVGVDQIFAGDGNDSVQAGGGNDLIFGDAGNDTLLGDDGADVIRGGDGADNLQGGAGDDVLVGESADDFLFGGFGNDAIFGDDGVDVILGNDGNDVIDGGDGNDILTGDLPTNAGQGGNDIIVGGAGIDAFFILEGSDTADGGDGDDVFGVFGGSAHSLSGGAGSDAFFSGGSNVTLVGGAGVDFFLAGAGADIFGYDTGYGPNDFIFGFDRTTGDKIRIAPNTNGSGVATAQDVLALTVSPDGVSAFIVLGGEAIVIAGVPQLQASDFIIGT